jgi:hypothetical protein
MAIHRLQYGQSAGKLLAILFGYSSGMRRHLLIALSGIMFLIGCARLPVTEVIASPTSSPVPTNTATPNPTVILTLDLPTPFPTPEPNLFGGCLPIDPSTLDDDPPDFDGYARILCGYFSAGGTRDEIEEQLRTWGVRDDMGGFVEPAGWVRNIPDITGDGIEEIAILAYSPYPSSHSTLYLIDCGHSLCRLLYSYDFFYSSIHYVTEIVLVDDINRDGRNNIVLTWTNPGVSHLNRFVDVLEWNPYREQITSLAAGDVLYLIGGSSPEVVDLDGDNIYEM